MGRARKSFTVDTYAVRDRQRKMGSDLIGLHLNNYKRSGAELILGSGRFIGPKTLEAKHFWGDLIRSSRPHLRYQNQSILLADRRQSLC